MFLSQKNNLSFFHLTGVQFETSTLPWLEQSTGDCGTGGCSDHAWWTLGGMESLKKNITDHKQVFYAITFLQINGNYCRLFLPFTFLFIPFE